MAAASLGPAGAQSISEKGFTLLRDLTYMAQVRRSCRSAKRLKMMRFQVLWPTKYRPTNLS